MEVTSTKVSVKVIVLGWVSLSKLCRRFSQVFLLHFHETCIYFLQSFSLQHQVKVFLIYQTTVVNIDFTKARFNSNKVCKPRLPHGHEKTAHKLVTIYPAFPIDIHFLQLTWMHEHFV